MPELPDLTVFAENLHRRLGGSQVSAVDCSRERRLNVDAETLRTAVCGGVVDAVARAGKEIELRLSHRARLRIHLMLSGRFVLTEDPDRLGDKMLTLRFTAGPALVVTDPKGLVKVALNPEPGAAPDALEADAAYLRQKAAGKLKTLAKAFLIDQAVLRGIGNAYADEILWAARISPKAAVGRIPGEAFEALAAAIHKVLTEATEKIRAAHPDIIGGEIRDFLLIHNPQRAQSPTGRPIGKEKIASKTTYFTDEQVLY
ncbi:MAG: DNA-formamidopyrimidine glycosylase family protein [Desulfuromonadales bacterium]